MKVFFDRACMSTYCWALPKPKYEPFITLNRGTLKESYHREHGKGLKGHSQRLLNALNKKYSSFISIECTLRTEKNHNSGGEKYNRFSLSLNFATALNNLHIVSPLMLLNKMRQGPEKCSHFFSRY